MTRDIWATPAMPHDIARLDELLRTTPQNLFDADILAYSKNIQFLCARNGQPLVFLPIQTVLMLESLGVEPTATELEVSKSIEVLIKNVVCTALQVGINELYFIVKDKSVAKYADRHGFETVMTDDKLKVTLFRLKVGKLCETRTVAAK